MVAAVDFNFAVRADGSDLLNSQGGLRDPLAPPCPIRILTQDSKLGFVPDTE